jgi:preprotein translocase subunit SecG
MDSLAIVILGLGFFTTVIALAAIARDKEDVAKVATKVQGQISKSVSQIARKE